MKLEASIVGIAFIVFMVLLFFGIPVVFALGFGGVLALVLQGTIPFELIPQRMIVSLNSFPLLAIPLFMFVGQSMNTTGVTEKLFDFARKLVGHITGGLGHVNVLASIIFAGMSGSAVADASGLGLIEIKAMEDSGFDTGFSAAVTAASSTIGPIIPPSIPLVVYGYIANQSVGRLFLAGIIPGLLMGVTMMILIYFIAKRRGYKKEERPTLKELWKSFIGAIPALFTPIIMVGGITFGVFTPTEGAAVTAVYTLFLGFVVYKSITIKDVIENLKSSARTSGVILLILAFAGIFSFITSVAGIPMIISNFLISITSNKYILLLLINFVLLISGCVMESNAIIAIGLPILYPLINGLGINPIHFGVLMILNLMIGLITPPFGLSLYVVAGVGRISVSKVIKETLPFLIPLIITLLMVTYIPGLTLWLPELLMGK